MVQDRRKQYQSKRLFKALNKWCNDKGLFKGSKLDEIGKEKAVNKIVDKILKDNA